MVKLDMSSKKLSSFFVVVASIAILVCISLLIQVSVGYDPNFKLPILNPSNAANEVLGYSCFLLFSIGMAILLIAINLVDAFELEKDITSFAFVFLGSSVITLSTVILLFDEQIQREIWNFFNGVSAGIYYIFFAFYFILSKRGNRSFDHIFFFLTIVYIGLSFWLYAFQQ
jgi:hypothetical protein